jgi:hypothetical protein
MVSNFMVGINMAVFSKNRQITPGMKSPGKVDTRKSKSEGITLLKTLVNIKEPT